MIGAIFSTIFYNPLYNGLILLLGLFPFIDVGIAIIIFTIIVKLILFPLSRKSARTQVLMRRYQGELAAIKEKNKGDRQKEAEATMQFYREKKINPFSGIVLLLIQFPILIALYWVFLKGGLPTVHPEILYPFIHAPAHVS